MQTAVAASKDVPTAQPGIEPEEDRENLLLDDQTDEFEDSEIEELATDNPTERKKSKVKRLVKGVAAFSIFLFLMGIAITWFFGMGRFATAKPQAINRNAPKDSPAAPMTEDEKLKAALTMVAAKEPDPLKGSITSQDETVTIEQPLADNAKGNGVSPNIPTKVGTELTPSQLGAETFTASPGQVDNTARTVKAPRNKLSDPTPTAGTWDKSVEPLGRSLFFGVDKVRSEPLRMAERRSETSSNEKPKDLPGINIPFGTLFPVRLLGAIYTLKDSGGVVRLELTQPVEGNGYSFPAGTMLVGNLRGGESLRAFVSIIGLIDPASGELVKFSGELMGTDGASGLSGKKKSITSKWTSFFRSLRETAGSVIGSVGAFRSSGTVVISDSLGRGSEKLSEATAQSLFENRRENTFLEVLAGTNGYVLVTQLPVTGTNATASKVGVEKE